MTIQQKDSLQENFTLNETETALNSTSAGGPDAIAISFYKKFRKILSPWLVRMDYYIKNNTMNIRYGESTGIFIEKQKK